MRTKTLLASLAIASLAVAHPVSAATRSVDSLPQSGAVTSDVGERVGSVSGEAEDLRGRPLLLVILIAAIVAALIAALSDGKSPG